MAIEIVDLPINSMIFHGFLYVYRRVGVFCPGRSKAKVPNSSRGAKLSHLPQGGLSHLPVDDGDFFGRRTGTLGAMTCHDVLVGECDRMTFSRSIVESIDVFFSIHKICSMFHIDIRDFPSIYVPSGFFNIWKIPDKWRSIPGKIIYFYGPSIPWLC